MLICVFPSFPRNVLYNWKPFIHTFILSPLIIWHVVPITMEFANCMWVIYIYDPYPFVSRNIFASGARALSGIALSLVKIATTRETLPAPHRLNHGRICRWLPKDLVEYQENRRQLRHENGKEKGRKESDTHRADRATNEYWWVNAAMGRRGKPGETQGEGTRRRKKETHGGVGSPAALKHVGLASCVSFGSALSSALSCS